MRNLIVLVFVVLLTACNPQKKGEALQSADSSKMDSTLKSIEPGNYVAFSWRIKKDVSYHDTVESWTMNGQKLVVLDENKLETTDSLGAFLFNGNSFSYKLAGDSLILTDSTSRKGYKVSGPSSNLIKFHIDNKYLDFIIFTKQSEQKAAASTDSIIN